MSRKDLLQREPADPAPVAAGVGVAGTAWLSALTAGGTVRVPCTTLFPPDEDGRPSWRTHSDWLLVTVTSSIHQPVLGIDNPAACPSRNRKSRAVPAKSLPGNWTV